LLYSYGNGIFSSRRIERATHRDIGVRFIAANTYPYHDTIAAFRRTNKTAFEAAFLHVLLLAPESGLLRVGTVSIDGTKIDASASKIRSVRAKELRAQLAVDIAAPTAQADTADTNDDDPQALPAEIARREALAAKLDAACARLEAQARDAADAARPAYEVKKAAHDAKTGRHGRAPKPPDDAPPPGRQSNLTDPDSALMRRSYNAQAVVCADGAQLILATNLVATTADTILAMEHSIGLPNVVLADTGFASGLAVAALEARRIEPLVAIGRTQPHRPHDFRPPPAAKVGRQFREPWRIAMKAKLETDDAKALFKKRKRTVEPAFGIIKSAMDFVRFHRRGISNVATEWKLVALACNCRRIANMKAA